MSNSPDGQAATKRGRLFVISGPSGTGKTSICDALLKQLPDTEWSVSATTRPKRMGDVEGETYEFISDREFAERNEAGEFLESAEYVGFRYGTPRGPIVEAMGRGMDVVSEIDVQGGMQIAAKMPESIRIFVLPPSVDSLRARLEGRKTEAKEQLAKRLAQAEGEIATAKESGCYQYFVVNDVLDAAIDKVKRIIEQETGRV